MAVTWDDNLDEIFAADLTAALDYRTPAGGVVVQAVAPIGLRDRERGMVGFTTSLGFSKKLERIAADPRVAMAFHAREHGRATTSRYVLVQGSAHVIEQPSAATRDLIRTQAAAYLGPPREGLFWDRWLREYYVSRVPVVISVTRILTWPALDAAGAPLTAGGEPLPSAAAEPQRPPKNGTGPRIDVARAAKRLRARRRTRCSAMPAPTACRSSCRSTSSPTTRAASRSAAGLPPAGRRAGLLGHSYRPQLIGLTTRQHTGWLDVRDETGARYAPHTETGYRAPPNKTLLLLLNGALAKKGVRQAARKPPAMIGRPCER